ncbi:hypothetical protein [Nocardioides insulae]|uniref:hypothetical protein n=1 Tax=Nocardioides insulae TaxID=394734 RepID=UPI000426665C|nr:hypothetical protein [Nocardioides insulae]
MTLAVSLDALSRDAVRWEETAAALTRMRHVLAGLALPTAEFSFAGASPAGAYQDLLDRLDDHLADGVRATEDAATALRAVRATYETTDGAVRERMHEQWRPLAG